MSNITINDKIHVELVQFLTSLKVNMCEQTIKVYSLFDSLNFAGTKVMQYACVILIPRLI